MLGELASLTSNFCIIAGWIKKFDLQLMSQCGITHNCQSRSVPGIHLPYNTWGRYHRGRRPSSDDSFRSPTVILPSALDKPRIMKRYHRRWMCSHTSPHHSPTMVTRHDTQFVECRWSNDGWTVKTVVTWRSSASMIPAPDAWQVWGSRQESRVPVLKSMVLMT